MRRSHSERLDNDKGFTLIELMVVVLIIAILLAIAIPTFLGAQNKAKDRSAQSAARNALTTAKTLYADTGSYLAFGGDAPGILLLAAAEPALKFLAAASLSTTATTAISVGVATDTTWWAAVMSADGTCFFIRDSIIAGSTGGTQYGKDTVAANCNGSYAKATVVYSATGWS